MGRKHVKRGREPMPEKPKAWQEQHQQRSGAHAHVDVNGERVVLIGLHRKVEATVAADSLAVQHLAKGEFQSADTF